MRLLLESLRRLKGQSVLSELDLHFAALMGRLDTDPDSDLLLAAALTSRASGEGHVCLQLADWSGRMLGERGSDAELQLPTLEEWLERLQRSPVVGRPGQWRPLVLDQHGRLYLYRYWRYQQQLADALLARAQSESPLQEPARFRSLLDQLFPVDPGTTDWQRVAACVATMKRLTVISGGPGTGKTSTVVRILALLLQQAVDQPLVIALAAPTGKAAARLQDSIQQAKADLPVDAALRERIPEQAMTLHRLMGSRPDSIHFRHDATNPLPLDLLVIDEASMVDMALMAKVIGALPATARLILLGDRHQLASVEAGAVLGDICGEDRDFSAPFRERLSRLGGLNLPDREEGRGGLSDSVVELTHSYRFASGGGIGRLADAVNRGAAEEALNLLKDERLQDIELLPAGCDLLAVALAGYRDYLGLIERRGSVAEVFAAFARFRVLCALRSGQFGVAGLNRAIHQGLIEAGTLGAGEVWYTGRPLMITRNDYNLRLYNGDIGILLPDETGRGRVFFQTPEGYRSIAPARLPPHETAFAMTVHKSQGSEFDRVLLILPDSPGPLLTRELIYTGLTRARSAFSLADRNGVLSHALSQRIRRLSGLQALLWK